MKIPRRERRRISAAGTRLNLTILLALLPALLTAATLLATLASGLLLLLTGLLLAALLAPLLLPALLHIAHLVVRHEELSFAEGFRATDMS